MERDEVPEPFAAREHAHDPVLLFRQVVSVQFVVVQAGHLEVKIIDHHMVDARFGDELRQMGLPDPLGEPHAAGLVFQRRFDEGGELPDLADLVLVRKHREDRLIEPAGQDLGAALANELLQHIDKLGMFLLKEPVEDAGVMQRDLDRRVPVQDLQEREVGFLIGVLCHEIEIADRLMVVDRKDELYLGHVR